MSKHRILFLDFLVLLSIFFLAKIFLPLPWISDSRRLSRRIHNASASWKKGPKSPVNSSSLVLLCPPSSLYDLSPPSNGLVYMSIFLPSWHFSHFPKIEFRWPFSSPPFLVGYAHTKVQLATQYITPRELTWSPIWWRCHHRSFSFMFSIAFTSLPFSVCICQIWENEVSFFLGEYTWG